MSDGLNIRLRPPADVLLDVNDLVVHFPAGRRGMFGPPSKVHAVDGVSFRVRRGTTFGIVGESGSGKSTTAQAVMRLIPDDLRPDRVRRREHRRLPRRETAAGAQQIPDRVSGSVLGARSAPPRRRSDPRTARSARHRLATRARGRVKQLLEEVGLPPQAADLFPHQFSGGQRQRLCIARAMAPEPDLIVCDEAVSALDVAIQAQILNLLKKLQRERGLTYIFISHDLGVIQHFCDEIAVMYLGKIVEQAPAQVFFSARLASL
jgi:peptide/nickel transport system ATP-binding protein